MHLPTGRNNLVIHKCILFLLGECQQLEDNQTLLCLTVSEMAKAPEPAPVISRARSSACTSNGAVVPGRPGWLRAWVLVWGIRTDAQRHRTPGTPAELLAAGSTVALRALQELQREDATEMQSTIIAVLASAEKRYLSANCCYKS